MYDFSLIEKYTNIKYHIEYFVLNDEEDRERLSKLITEISNKENTKMLPRKEYFSDKTGDIMSVLEWMEYEKEKESPFLKD